MGKKSEERGRKGRKREREREREKKEENNKGLKWLYQYSQMFSLYKVSVYLFTVVP